jgi:hypothetical protein
VDLGGAAGLLIAAGVILSPNATAATLRLIAR